MIPHHDRGFAQRNTLSCQNADVRTDADRSHPLRATGVVILLAITYVMAALTPVAIWARGQVLDTDRYLATVSPLASDRAIQKDVAARVTDAIEKQLRARGLTGGQQVGGDLGNRVDQAAHQAIESTTLQVVESSAFKALWVAANRQAHDQLVRVLTGEAPESVVVSHGRITIDLTGVVDQVRQHLSTLGIKLISQLPPIHLVLDVADASGLQSAQQAVKVLKTLAWALPVLTLLFLALAVLVSTRRWRTALRGFGGIIITMLVLRLLVMIGDDVAAANVPRDIAGDTAVHHYYAHLTSLLDHGMLTTGIVAAVGVLVVTLLGGTPRPWSSLALAVAGVVVLASWTWLALVIVVLLAIASALLRRGIWQTDH